MRSFKLNHIVGKNALEDLSMSGVDVEEAIKYFYRRDFRRICG